ncbi:hypothetical protein BT96DRAFT_944097 [Gymnopus androsaceus JB14]|uniref:Glycan binding protein Y3-like domain-containing protein n=1 Tax=Gymnopus androsaceus JB14 TaxID=1447944 RepID=A0A6A4H624_9AGAR|nr:hypothetical protein BT96DRAFT_944097 [Gymnopus androsaceus JB14]
MFFNYRKIAYVTLSVAAPAIGQTVSVGCFSTGTAGVCVDHIQTFCQSGQNILPVGPQNTYARCFNEDGYKCDLTAWNLLPSSSDGDVPSAVNCQTILDTISEVCPQGGQGSITAGTFVFTLDPNEGSCGADAIAGGLGSST